MKPEDLKLKMSGIQCIHVDENEKVVGIIVPEGWAVHVLPSDSGQVLDRTDLQMGCFLKPRRVRAAPTLENVPKR